MFKTLLLCPLLLIASIILRAQENIQLPSLKAQIDSLYQVDQQVQLDFIAAYQRGATMDSIMIYENIKNETFKRHIPIVKNIIATYGYPSIEKVGKESATNFFPLIQHADSDVNFQSDMLPIIKEQVEKGLINGADYAFLYDRIKVNTGKKQLYGTQLTYNEKHIAVPKPLKFKNGVNKRRAELGMESLEDYLNKATELHKIMNGLD